MAAVLASMGMLLLLLVLLMVVSGVMETKQGPDVLLVWIGRKNDGHCWTASSKVRDGGELEKRLEHWMEPKSIQQKRPKKINLRWIYLRDILNGFTGTFTGTFAG